jgi:hypothetical protein
VLVEVSEQEDRRLTHRIELRREVREGVRVERGGANVVVLLETRLGRRVVPRNLSARPEKKFVRNRSAVSDELA